MVWLFDRGVVEANTRLRKGALLIGVGVMPPYTPKSSRPMFIDQDEDDVSFCPDDRQVGVLPV